MNYHRCEFILAEKNWKLVKYDVIAQNLQFLIQNKHIQIVE